MTIDRGVMISDLYKRLCVMNMKSGFGQRISMMGMKAGFK
jgi:hypothetical protein